MVLDVAAEGQGDPLSAFDLSWPLLRDAVLLRAQGAASDYRSDLYPPGSSGSVRYMHLVAHLTETLAPRGWRRHDENNVPRLVAPDGNRALVVTSGDAATGQPSHYLGHGPRSKYPKGQAVRRVVRENTTPALFAFGPTEPPLMRAALKTWFLMVHVTPLVIQSEVSLPDDPGGGEGRRHIDHWIDRILLPNLPNDIGDQDDLDWDGEEGEAIDVPVDPR